MQWAQARRNADRAARTRRERSARVFQARPSGRREAVGSAWGCAGRNRPPLHRGRRFRADRSPLPKGEDGTARRTDPQGCVRAQDGIAARRLFAEAGGARIAGEREARWTEQDGRVRGKAGFAKSRAGTGRRQVSLAGNGPWRPNGGALSLGKRTEWRPERPTALADRESGRLPRRQAVSCRALARSLTGPGNLTPPFFKGRRIADQAPSRALPMCF
jgi:hypothetical protein